MNPQLKRKLVDLLLPYGPERISVFGSYARGDQTAASDLDVLVRFRNRMGILTLTQIQQKLSDSIGVSIDLVTESSLKNPLLKESISKDLIVIYK